MQLRHLHNQNAVLRRQADQRHQTHLRIDIQIDRAHRQKSQRPQHRQGHRHQNDHRRYVAFVLGREHQIHHQNAQAKHQHTRIAGRKLQRRQAGEGIANIVEIQLAEQRLDLIERLARTLAIPLLPLDQHRAVQVEVADHRWRTAQLRTGKLRHLHHLAIAAAHVVPQNILQAAAVCGLGLHIDIAHLARLVGKAAVVAARQHGDRIHRLLEIDVQRPHNRAVYAQRIGGRTGDELGVDLAEIARVAALTHQLVRQIIQLVEAIGAVAFVVELEIEAPLARKPRHRRRRARHRHAAAQGRETTVQALDDRRRLGAAPPPLLQRLEAVEEHPLIRAGAVEAIAAHHRCGDDLLLLRQHRRHLPGHRLRLAQGGAVLQLEDAQPIALVLLRDKGRRQRLKGDTGEHNAAQQPRQDPAAPLDQARYQSRIAALHPREEGIEARKNPGQIRPRQPPGHQAHPIGERLEGGGRKPPERRPQHQASHQSHQPPRRLRLLTAQDQRRQHR